MNSEDDTLAGGLPHSEIPGSPIARISPGLFAACHVLHRLSVPRHPPDALIQRLSATPNGKNHRDIRYQTRYHKPDITRQICRHAANSLSEDLVRDPRRGLAAARGLPPRSHNSLL